MQQGRERSVVRDLPRQVQVHTVFPTVPDIPTVRKEKQGTRRTYPQATAIQRPRNQAQLQVSPDQLQDRLVVSYLWYIHLTHKGDNSNYNSSHIVIDRTHSAICMALHLILSQYTHKIQEFPTVSRTLTTKLSKKCPQPVGGL